MKDIERLGQDLRRIISGKHSTYQLIEKASSLLCEFTPSTRWLAEVLEDNLFDGDGFLFNSNSIWPNEIRLLNSPEYDFTLLAYIWAPHTIDYIHDHGSWGVIGPCSQPIHERKYHRLDNGSKEGYAELAEISHKIVAPGATTHVLPLNEGIHCIENATDSYVISLNIYGRSTRHGYVQYFDQTERRVWQVYPPKIHKKMMIIRALSEIHEPWVELLLQNGLAVDLLNVIKKQCEISLQRLRR